MTRAHPAQLPRRLRVGFTLVEMTLAITIMTIVMTACVGAIVISAKAIPDGRSRPSGVVIETTALDTMTADMQFATAATLTSATDVTVTVPSHRPGATGGYDTVRYYWNQAAASTPLMRQVNGGTPVIVAGNVKEFALVYDRRSVAAPQTYSASAEAVIASCDSGNSYKTQQVTTSNSPYQPFQPSFPSNATSWNVTRVVFTARQDGSATETLNVGLYATSSNSPTGAPVATCPIAESSLATSYAQVTASFGQAASFTPGQTVAVQFTNGSGSGTAGDIEFASSSGGGLLGGLLGVVTGLLGGSNGDNLLCDIYGTYTTPDPPAKNYYLTNVRATIRTGSDTYARLATDIRVFNEPQVTGP